MLSARDNLSKWGKMPIFRASFLFYFSDRIGYGSGEWNYVSDVLNVVDFLNSFQVMIKDGTSF